MWNNVDEFTEWYKNNGYPFKPPASDPVYVTDHTHSAIIFREGRYQAELYLMGPNWATPNHSHPGVEHRIIFINGTISGTKNGELVNDSTSYSDMTNPDGTCVIFGYDTPMSVTDWHTVTVGAKGGILIITQKWNDGLTMTSQSVHYVGEPIGPEHAKHISADIKT